MKHFSSLSSIISLLIVNVIPLYGAIFHGWNVSTIIVLYWCENVVIGFYTVLKMLKAEGMGFSLQGMSIKLNGQSIENFSSLSSTVKRSFFIPFFTMHFGLFTFVHGIFVLVFFGMSVTSFAGILFGFLSMIVSHGISYQTNFIAHQEYKRVTVEGLFISPYPRMIVMHLTVIIGGMLIMSNQSIFALAFLVILKTLVDLGSHLFEHRKTFHLKLTK